MSRSFLPLLCLSLLGLFLTSPIPLRAWTLVSSDLVPASLPGGIQPVPVQSEADLDGDGLPEHLRLTDGRLDILSAGQTVWQSPRGWDVTQAEFGDLNRDGASEAILLVWRPFRAWPVDQWLPHGGRISGFKNAAGYSCQIILIGWGNGEYREKWAGSALAEPVTSFAVADLDRDGVQELITLQGSYADPGSAPARALKVWKWNGFGFSIVGGTKGTYTKMVAVRAMNGRILIVIP